MDEHDVGAAFASRHALLTWDDARGLGLTPQEIRWRVDIGRWSRVHPSVYRLAGAPVTYTQQVLAACLAIGPEAAASHRAAAALHGFVWFADPPVEVTTTRARSPELEAVVVHRLADMSMRWVHVVGGVPCTSVARTLVDLGAVCRPATVEKALDRAIGRRQVALSDVRTALLSVARKGRRGVGTMRKLLEDRGVDVETVGVLAARMATLLRKFGLPTPEIEFTILDEHGGFIAQVDFAYPDLRLAIEVIGYAHHSSLRAFRNDAQRRRLLAAQGWTVLEFHWREVDRLSGNVANELAGHIARLRRAVA